MSVGAHSRWAASFAAAMFAVVAIGACASIAGLSEYSASPADAGGDGGTDGAVSDAPRSDAWALDASGPATPIHLGPERP